MSQSDNPRPNPNNCERPVPVDPNDIIGYTSPAGSEHIGKDVTTLSYAVEFENDPAHATASASKITVDSRLEANVFDLGSFAAREFRIGNHSVALGGCKKCVRTIDMRPAIDGIAEVAVDFDDATGVLRLTVTSLDPLTMEPSEDHMQGVLPVNRDGNGQGELIYDIDIRKGLAHGTSVDNSASIVFDSNETIETPVWHNVTDYVLPKSRVTDVSIDDGLIFDITVEGTDEGSGIWNYDLYVRHAGQPTWKIAAEDLEDTDGQLSYTSEAPLNDVSFLTVASDRAGNRERSALDKLPGDVDSNGKVDANDALMITAYYVNTTVSIDLEVADMDGNGKIDSQDVVILRQIYVSSSIDSKRKIKRTNRRK